MRTYFIWNSELVQIGTRNIKGRIQSTYCSCN